MKWIILLTMKTIHTLLLFSMLMSFTAHSQLDSQRFYDEGNLVDQVYHSEEIGWTINVPQDWSLVSLEEQKGFEERGVGALESVADIEIEVERLRNLISFKKDMFNSFLSNSEPFTPDYEGEWDENNLALKELVEQAYKSQGIITEVTETSSILILIDDIPFETYEFKLYTPDGNLFLSQLMYSSLINGFDFGVCINYNNETDKKTMVEAFKNSTFKKQDSRSLSDVKILYIIDGKEMPESVLETLNPNDIANITVIKNKETISTYSDEDYEGVILITLINKTKN